jgi:hypothetical protein
LNTFQEHTAETLSQFSGKIEGLALAIDSLSSSGLTISQTDIASVQRTLNAHGQLLKQCLSFCTSAMSATQTLAPGISVKHASAMEHARMIIGPLGPLQANAPTIAVNTAEAGGNAFLAIGPTSFEGMSRDAFDFLGSK